MHKSKERYEIRDGIGGEFQFAEILINCWIAFEAYSCLRYNLDGVQARINAFCREHAQNYKTDFESLPSDLRENLARLSKHKVHDMRPNHSSDPPKEIKDGKNLSEIMEVIYQVRNNLFHGGKDVQDIKDRNIIEHSAIILYRLLERIFHSENYLA